MESGMDMVERPISSPLRKSDTDPAWMQVIKLFERHGLPAPPFRLRDELVVAFEWAWFGYAAALKQHEEAGK